MKLLVTGGCGFIGSAFIRYWIKEHPEDTIVNVDALTYAANPKALAEVEGSGRYTFVEGNICDKSLMLRTMKGMDAVINFAAETHVDRSVADSATFVATNFVGVNVLLECIKELGIKRFHQVSTDEVYGSLGPNDPPFTEETPYDPRSPYSASKAGADHLVRAYFHTHGTHVTISNCTNNYGPWQYPEKLIPVAVLKALKGEEIPIYGDGSNIRDWIFVDDHVKGLEQCLLHGKAGETYAFGGNAERSNLTIAKTILKELGLPDNKLRFVTDRPGHDFRYAISSEKAKRELGWEPATTFEAGIATTVAWYKERATEFAVDERGVHAKA